jgi:hypothetical protein
LRGTYDGIKAAKVWPGRMPEQLHTGTCWRLVSPIWVVRAHQKVKECGRSLAEIARQVNTFNSLVPEVLQNQPNQIIPVLQQRPLPLEFECDMAYWNSLIGPLLRSISPSYGVELDQPADKCSLGYA